MERSLQTDSLTFSVCLTVYGRRVGVETTLESIYKYVSKSWEIVIIFSESDDLPWDEFVNLVDKYLADRKYKIKKIPANGIYPALNSAILEVQTDYFTFCHSGDRYIRPLTAKALTIEELADYDIYTFPVQIGQTVSPPRLAHHLSYDISINHMCSFFKTSRHVMELYDVRFKFSADWWCIIQMSRKGISIGEGSHVLLAFDTNGASSSVSIKRLSEDLYILLLSSWNRGNIKLKLLRGVKEILGYVYGKIKRNYKYI